MYVPSGYIQHARLRAKTLRTHDIRVESDQTAGAPSTGSAACARSATVIAKAAPTRVR